MEEVNDVAVGILRDIYCQALDIEDGQEYRVLLALCKRLEEELPEQAAQWEVDIEEILQEAPDLDEG